MRKRIIQKGKDPKKSFEVEHKEQGPEIPKPVYEAPKEATDPAEALKHA